jgi:D-arabinose 1-dehydrogenase-like Zn-dependent alcohol dehydrogenase
MELCIIVLLNNLAIQDMNSIIIHWNEEDHEQYIVERTLDACKGGVDVIVDFVSSPRTVQRDLKVLNRVSRNLFCFYITYFFPYKNELLEILYRSSTM